MTDELERIPENEFWVIKYADADVSDDIFVGETAEEDARRAFENRSINWNCYLFAPIRVVADLQAKLEEKEDTRPDAHLLLSHEALQAENAALKTENEQWDVMCGKLHGEVQDLKKQLTKKLRKEC